MARQTDNRGLELLDERSSGNDRDRSFGKMSPQLQKPGAVGRNVPRAGQGRRQAEDSAEEPLKLQTIDALQSRPLTHSVQDLLRLSSQNPDAFKYRAKKDEWPSIQDVLIDQAGQAVIAPHKRGAAAMVGFGDWIAPDSDGPINKYQDEEGWGQILNHRQIIGRGWSQYWQEAYQEALDNARKTAVTLPVPILQDMHELIKSEVGSVFSGDLIRGAKTVGPMIDRYGEERIEKKKSAGKAGGSALLHGAIDALGKGLVKRMKVKAWDSELIDNLREEITEGQLQELGHKLADQYMSDEPVDWDAFVQEAPDEAMRTFLKSLIKGSMKTAKDKATRDYLYRTDPAGARERDLKAWEEEIKSRQWDEYLGSESSERTAVRQLDPKMVRSVEQKPSVNNPVTHLQQPPVSGYGVPAGTSMEVVPGYVTPGAQRIAK